MYVCDAGFDPKYEGESMTSKDEELGHEGMIMRCAIGLSSHFRLRAHGRAGEQREGATRFATGEMDMMGNEQSM